MSHSEKGEETRPGDEPAIDRGVDSSGPPGDGAGSPGGGVGPDRSVLPDGGGDEPTGLKQADDLPTEDDPSEAVIIDKLETIEQATTSLGVKLEMQVNQSTLPLPSAAVVRDYNDVIPGFGDLMMTHWQREQDARIAREERRAIAAELEATRNHEIMLAELAYEKAELANQQRAEMAGLVAASTMVGGVLIAVYWVAFVSAWVAVSLSAVLIGLAAIFITRRRGAMTEQPDQREITKQGE